MASLPTWSPASTLINTGSAQSNIESSASESTQLPRSKPRGRRRNAQNVEDDDSIKRKCVSTACVACRKRKSKCDGNTPACAACSQVYNTACVYDPNSDHRRKGVYKNDLDNLKTRNTTLHTLIEAILNYDEEDVPDLVKEIRTCESLDEVAERIIAKENGRDVEHAVQEIEAAQRPAFESRLYSNVGDLRLEDGSVRYIGGTSNLIHVEQGDEQTINNDNDYQQQEHPILTWTNVTDDPELITHLLDMYFTWHYTYFTTLSKSLFYRDFNFGRSPMETRKSKYCSPLLVNAMLALGCHFTARAGAWEMDDDSATAGDHFFREAKRLLVEEDEMERPCLTTVQALALMSVREAGCGREAKGWVYSGMSFRMSQDMGLHLDAGHISGQLNSDELDEDARRITFWGSFLFDKCWSNYLGRLPQIPRAMITTPKFDVFPDEDAAPWLPYTDSGFNQANTQPARTRTVALEISKLCEINSDLLQYFYNPIDADKARGKQAEMKKLSEIHSRLETWRRELPKELEPKEGGLSSVLIMHMFFQILFVHLFRPFLKYTQSTSPLPSNISPRKLCTSAAGMISKLLRLYKRSHGLRQICNVAVYIAHSACTIHLLNLPDKLARRDIVHGVKHLEEIAEGWLCARRSLNILSVLAQKWKIDLPLEAQEVLVRTDAKFGALKQDAMSPGPNNGLSRSRNGSSQDNNVAATRPTSGHAAGSIGNVGFGISNNSTALAQSSAHGGGAQEYVIHTPPQYLATPDTPVSFGDNAVVRGAPLANDPSAMFGGIEQLLRDTQDWAYRDQAQYGAGFGNWNATPEGNGQWTANNGQAAAHTRDVQASTSPVDHLNMPAGPLRAYQTSMASDRASFDVTNAPLASGEIDMNAYDAVMDYNEREWYQ